MGTDAELGKRTLFFNDLALSLCYYLPRLRWLVIFFALASCIFLFSCMLVWLDDWFKVSLKERKPDWSLDLKKYTDLRTTAFSFRGNLVSRSMKNIKIRQCLPWALWQEDVPWFVNAWQCSSQGEPPPSRQAGGPKDFQSSKKSWLKLI